MENCEVILSGGFNLVIESLIFSRRVKEAKGDRLCYQFQSRNRESYLFKCDMRTRREWESPFQSRNRESYLFKLVVLTLDPAGI